MKNKYRSNLSVAKGLGSAGSGAGHWWHQRFSAVILALATIWLFYFSWELSAEEPGGAIHVLKRPGHVIMLSLFTLTGLYHAAIGMQVVIEDYVHCRAVRLFLLLFIQIFSIITAISFILALLYAMFA